MPFIQVKCIDWDTCVHGTDVKAFYNVQIEFIQLCYLKQNS